MELSNRPPKIAVAFATSGDREAIPQSTIVPGRATYPLGFPPVTRQAKVAGGVPPFGTDFNGAFYEQSIILRWQSAGGMFSYDSAFSSAVGGYPRGSVLLSADATTEWLCTADSNGTNPDATDGSPANWAPLSSYGVAAVTGLTNANVTLTPAQYSKDTIILSGTLTGNVQILFPPLAKRWLVINNTGGAFSLTCKTVSGTGALLPGGQSEEFYGDGTNLVPRTYPQQVPAGKIDYFAFASVPSGYLAANGAAVSRTTYPTLFAAIGTTYGAGDGTTTFNVPELRGVFPRGWDDGRGVDPARALGSDQLDAFKAHTHIISEGSNVPQSGGMLTSGDDFTNAVAFGQTTTSTGGTETRPRNVALHACIKT